MSGRRNKKKGEKGKVHPALEGGHVEYEGSREKKRRTS